MKSPPTVLFFAGLLCFCFANDFAICGLLGLGCWGLLALWVIAVWDDPSPKRRSRSDDDDYFYAQGGDGDGY